MYWAVMVAMQLAPEIHSWNNIVYYFDSLKWKDKKICKEAGNVSTEKYTKNKKKTVQKFHYFVIALH